MLDASGTLQREYIYLGNIPIAVLDVSGTMSYIHTDHLNTPRVITDGTQQVVWRWDQAEPFGSDPANSNPSGLGVFEFNPRLPGQYFDKETNLHYNYFRDYDPATGRYPQSDSIGIEGGINTYIYVENNPLFDIDPLGLCGEKRDCLQEALNSYSLEKSLNNIVGFGVGSALTAGGAQVLNKSAIKPREGISGGGPSGRYTSFSRKYLGSGIGKIIGRVAVGTVAKAAGILGAGAAAYSLHYDALKIYLDCRAEQ